MHCKNTFLAALATVAFAATSASAQPAGNIHSTTRYTVVPARSGDLNAAIKDYNEVLKKAGWDKPRIVWRSLTGPSELLLTSFHEKFAELDANMLKDPKLKDYATDLTRIATRITESFSHSERVIDIVNPGLSLPMSTEAPKMLMVWTAHVKQDKTREFLDLQKNEFLPAMKAAGMKIYLFAHTRFGGVSNEYRDYSGLDNWAAIDGENPIRKGMGDKYQAFTAHMNSLLEDYRYDIYRFDADLSYIPAK